MTKPKKGLTKECSKIIAVRVAQVDYDIIQSVATNREVSNSDIIRWAIAVWQDSEREAIQRAISRQVI